VVGFVWPQGKTNGHCPESGGGCHLEAGGDIECECTVALLSFTFVQPDKA